MIFLLLFDWIRHFRKGERVVCIEILKLEQVYLHSCSKNFVGNHFVKHWLISSIEKVLYFKGTILQGSTYVQNLSSLHKIGWRLAEKKNFFQTCFF
jgi:hypothetical protein